MTNGEERELRSGGGATGTWRSRHLYTVRMLIDTQNEQSTGITRRKTKVRRRGRMPLTTTARGGIIVLVNLDRTFCGSHNGADGVGLRIDQPRLDIPSDEMNGDVVALEADTDKYLARVKKASSTPSLTFADVSMNWMPSSWANSLPCCSVMTLLSFQSDLFPIRILFTPSEACCSMLECHVRISRDNRIERRW